MERFIARRVGNRHDAEDLLQDIFLEGRTQREVAEELGLSPSGAKSRVQRARKKLKAILQSCCRFELDRLGNVLGYAPRGETCRHCSC